MVLDQATLMLWLGHFLWPFLRITGLFLTAPLYGSPLIPALVKALAAAALAACLAGWLPHLPPYPADPFSAIQAGLTQIVYGALIGMTMQIVIAAIASAGEIAGLAMGLSFAELQFRESPGATPVLYNIMVWAGLAGFIASGGPLWVFAALAQSFAHGIGTDDLASWAALLPLGEMLMRTSVCLALPVLAVALSVNLVIGLTTVFAPQMNLLTIGFPLLILAGLWILVSASAALQPAIAAAMMAAEHAVATMQAGG